jgi:hypothetical protein
MFALPNPEIRVRGSFVKSSEKRFISVMPPRENFLSSFAWKDGDMSLFCANKLLFFAQNRTKSH